MMTKKKLICLNVHYSPESFGGATIVAEQVNTILAKEYNWEILVVTTRNDSKFMPYHTIKYFSKGVSVVSVNIPDSTLNDDLIYNNVLFENILEDIIESFQPDVCHGHAVQNIGFNFASVMKRHEVTVFLTLHDCLWLCEKQFMINNHGRYCNQKEIDPSVCLYCVSNPSSLKKRNKFFARMYPMVDIFLFPSQFHMDLHLQNGFEATKCRVSKNGVTFPKPGYCKTSSDTVRFGFIGGPGYIKGANLIKEVFTELKGEYILKLVDAGAKVNHPWAPAFESWGLSEDKFEILDSYDQDTMDNFFNKIDVLLFPSQWKESFGLTVREALVRNVWVVATNGGGTIEDMMDNENSTIIPITNNHEYLKSAVEDLLLKDWSTYTNKYKNEILNYNDQAEELDTLLNDVLSKKTSMVY